jgi:PAS domain S-box-containing protein
MRNTKLKGTTTQNLSSKNITEQLQVNDIFYKHVVELTPEAVVVHCEGKIIYANPATLTLIGAKSAKEIVGKSVMSFIHKDSISLIQSRIKTMLSNHKVAPYAEEKFINLKNEIILAETKAVPFTFKGKPAILAILHDISARKKAEEKKEYLEKVSTLLNASVDYKTTLNTICKLLVPHLADYIRIALIDDKNQIEEVATYHVNPRKLPLVKKLYAVYGRRKDIKQGVPRVMQSGKSEITERLNFKTVFAFEKNDEIKNLVTKLGLISYMGVPLKVNKKVIGVITISSARKDRIYTKDDLQFAEEIANRISYAVENARLFSNLQKELYEKIEAQEGQARMASYLDQTFDAVLLWKFKGEIVYWNKGAEELYGYSKDEAIGRKTHDLLKTIHPIPLSKVESQLFKKGRWEGELIHVTKNNIKHTVSCKKIMFTEKDGTKYVLETNRDVTDKLRFEKNLRFLSDSSKILASSLDYKTTLTNIVKLAVPEIADWCSLDMKTEKGIEQLAVAHIDPKKVKWAKELNRKNPSDPNATTGVPHVMRTGKSEFYPLITDEMLFQVAKDEDELLLLRNLMLGSVMMVPILTNKETIGVITFVSAESGHHYAKSDLAIAEELSVRAGLAIENAKLYADAQRAISVRDEFISLASHELKTPITSLKIYAQSLSKQFEKRGEPLLQQYSQRMDEQTDRLALLVNDLLNVSKIQHGKLDYNWEDVDLNKIVKDTVDALQGATAKHKIIIKGNIEKTVHADPYRIYQVITNLLTNAIKYSPDADKVVIQLSSKNGHIFVEVQDFGIGITSDQFKKIFNPFYRVKNPSERRFPGLGMGLFISNEIIERHGGKMNVISSKGKGSRFSFTLPQSVARKKESSLNIDRKYPLTA